MASKVQGQAKMRRLLRQLPDEARADILGVMERGGRRAQAAMKARARHRTGKLQAGVRYRMLNKSLRMQVGLLGTKRGRAKLFYGFVLDKGRKAQTVTVRRIAKGLGRGKPAGTVSSYQMRVRALRGDEFVSGRYPEVKSSIGADARQTFTRVLKKVGAGRG